MEKGKKYQHLSKEVEKELTEAETQNVKTALKNRIEKRKRLVAELATLNEEIGQLEATGKIADKTIVVKEGLLANVTAPVTFSATNSGSSSALHIFV